MTDTEARRLAIKHNINFNSILFISDALALATRDRTDVNHISGSALCGYVAAYAIDEFGCLARAVLNTLGFNSTHDIGKLVFKMIDMKMLAKDENDTLDEFINVYNFDKIFKTETILPIALNNDTNSNN